MHVIPSIDLAAGRCVRLQQGKFDAVTEYAIDPLQQAQRYAAAGLSWVHLVDLDGCRAGRPVNADVIAAIAAIPGLRLQAGGGIRDIDTVRSYLAAGVARAVIGSRAFQAPDDVAGWISELGPERVVIAADVRIDNGIPQALVDGWRADAGAGFYDTLDFFGDRGVRHLLCTDVSRDGMMAGPGSLYSALCARYPQMSVQASGGVRDAGDLAALQRDGAAAAIVGKSLLDGVMQPEELSQWSPAG
ncbi:MAG: 1-(5-phosphoribosyl)-5-[(5-phosphoribosylamino)methylideneamino] imidazole-4-carboxamide isomerase [Gammaproteobacteria bacterium]|nr:1-(5-phosphoribosyl)-5-[(5-phosphoribosylamino)methylideneamino] imidazole-4-carboxamide isomerase [Gammaproteobacteria bacterium]NNF62304.1 1-(5-phosphoribosyl)-5-[(5-phosphoribosylamino)methylideneamino] imidazole-4-carboxamide isomerase [Gammaproteobacteria bacterium]NNM21215.1 1-(5-phosphoribosyl)-5-[(5-phosphoribosylamino)methylideneamino] imidazole-4-carboxamide isomerase [Gammaproteobacteria bacterium]